LADERELASTIDDSDLNRATAEALVEAIKTKAEVHRFRRIGTRFSKWDLPRSFVGYRADPTTQTSGSAPKWVLKSADGQTQYIVKLPYRYGQRETLTELLINQLGTAFGFDMAHSGLVSVDGSPAFVSRSFLAPKDFLVHGIFLIEEVHELEHGELEKLPRGRKEQEFYSIDFVIQNIEHFCGDVSKRSVITKFVEMLLFDALVGATDRHAQNWGVIRASTTQGDYRFSPIFDTSRGLFWNLADDKLQSLQKDEMALRCHIDRACPVMGPERKALKAARCNHFAFLSNLFALFPHLTTDAVTKVTSVLCGVECQTDTILNSFPFRGAFSKLRRDLILKLIMLRADMVYQVLIRGEVRAT
jgi:hypothetical protein